MADFTWHEMAEEKPQDDNARYVLHGNGGAYYLAAGYMVLHDGSRSFRIPNYRGGYVDERSVRAWAALPEYEGAS